MATLTKVIGEAKKLACQYRALTGKPLGISGEVAEFEAHRHLGLELAPARMPGYDARRIDGGQQQRIQIKGRVIERSGRHAGRVPKISMAHDFDSVVLVLLDQATLEPFEMWEAPRHRIAEALSRPGSKARNIRGSLGITQFCRLAERVWHSPQ